MRYAINYRLFFQKITFIDVEESEIYYDTIDECFNK